MPRMVAHSALLQCDQGMAPSNLVIPPRQVSSEKMQVANQEDHVALMNIMPFGMCRSPLNPQVMAATAAAGGVPTPAPCIPMTNLPWEMPSMLVTEQVGARAIPVLLEHSICRCDWVGQITVVVPMCEQTADY